MWSYIQNISNTISKITSSITKAANSFAGLIFGYDYWNYDWGDFWSGIFIGKIFSLPFILFFRIYRAGLYTLDFLNQKIDSVLISAATIIGARFAKGIRHYLVRPLILCLGIFEIIVFMAPVVGLSYYCCSSLASVDSAILSAAMEMSVYGIIIFGVNFVNNYNDILMTDELSNDKFDIEVEHEINRFNELQRRLTETQVELQIVRERLQQARVNIISDASLNEEQLLSDAWNKAIKNHDIKDLLKILQSEYERRGRFNLKLNVHDELNFSENYSGALWKNVSEYNLDKIASDNNNLELICSISHDFMDIPVYIKNTNNHKFYFDLVSILKWFDNKYNFVVPNDRSIITNLNNIVYDAEMYQRILTVANSVKDKTCAEINFDNLFKNCICEQNLLPVITCLQSQELRLPPYTGLLCWTLDMKTSLQKLKDRNDDFYIGFLKEDILRMEDNDENISYICPITSQIMRNPVYIVGGDDQRYYFDLLPLLSVLSKTNTVSVGNANMEITINHLQELHYDVIKRDEIINKFNLILKPQLLFSKRIEEVGDHSKSTTFRMRRYASV